MPEELCRLEHWPKRGTRVRYSSSAVLRGNLGCTARVSHDSRGARISCAIFGSDAIDCGAVFEWEDGEAGLFEVGGGASDRVVQGAGGFVGVGVAVEEWACRGGGGV